MANDSVGPLPLTSKSFPICCLPVLSFDALLSGYWEWQKSAEKIICGSLLSLFNYTTFGHVSRQPRIYGAEPLCHHYMSRSHSYLDVRVSSWYRMSLTFNTVPKLFLKSTLKYPNTCFGLYEHHEVLKLFVGGGACRAHMISLAVPYILVYSYSFLVYSSVMGRCSCAARVSLWLLCFIRLSFRRCVFSCDRLKNRTKANSTDV
jgi:hypothetical protein